MPRALTKLVLNHAEVARLLRSPEVLGELQRRGNAIAAAAGGPGEGFVAEGHVGRNRARVTVRTATTRARVLEAQHRTLTKALDAGRG